MRAFARRMLAALLAAVLLPIALPQTAHAAQEEAPLRLLCRAVEREAELQPEDLLAPNGNPTNARLRFTEPPDTGSCGEQRVTVVASLNGKDVAEAETQILVCDRVLRLELDGQYYRGLKLRDMVDTELHGFHPDPDGFTADQTGVFPLLFTKGREEMLVGLEVLDTVAPKGTAVEAPCYLGYPRPAADFVTNVEDEQPVEISYTEEPDWETEGERVVQIRLTDASGNRSELKIPTLFRRDTTPPVLKVEIPRYYYVGDTVAYMKRVSATDDLDPACTISVDKSRVRQRELGSYPVTYTAVDRDGNESRVTVELHFIEPSVSDEELDALAQSILDEILTDNMSLARKARAIYRYVNSRIHYFGSSGEKDWKGEAYRGLTEFNGDCYTFFAASYLLLSKLDCEVLPVERIDGKTTHYWCLVNLGTGWYHFDATPNKMGIQCFMLNNNELYSSNIGSYFWKYEIDAFPEVADEPFQLF